MEFDKVMQEELIGQTINNVKDPRVMQAQLKGLQDQLKGVKEPDERSAILKNVKDTQLKRQALVKQKALQKQINAMNKNTNLGPANTNIG